MKFTLSRRGFVAGVITVVTLGAYVFSSKIGESRMYGLIVKITSVVGERDKLMSILHDGTLNMPGNISYNIAKDQGNDNDIWITEIWDNKESQEASVQLPSVQNAISLGRPLITEMSRVAITSPMVRTA